MSPAHVTPAAEPVLRLVGKLRRIPDEVRDFAVSPQEAWAEFRIPPQELRAVIDAGLPVRDTGDAIRYDRSDLINVSLHLGVGPWAHALRTFLPRALNRAEQGHTPTLAVSVRAVCPSPDHLEPCRYEVLTQGGLTCHTTPPGTALSAPVAHFQTRPDLRELPAAASELAASVENLDFVWLPEAVREDLDFVRDTGLGDCIAVSRMLAAEGRRRGLAMRPCYGLLAVVPQSIVHFWVEIDVDGEWMPMDPVLARALLGWGVVDARRRTATFSFGAVACRLADAFTPLVAHAGARVRYSLPTATLESRRNDG
ncbi:transglutaminase domain-containing protein [Micromonospora sp. NPDC005652]|uniref:transglutaminase domain-containing protein n=1 Tax=Micromonospora sp. NPDC005652 TaxID=3157046 RepID=UPI0033C0D1FF